MNEAKIKAVKIVVDLIEGTTHPEASGYEGPLADHMAKFMQCYGGLWRPPHMTAEQYQDFLANYSDEDIAGYRRFWLEYEVPSAWTETAEAFATAT